MRIIVVAFGGDNAPFEILKGAAMALAEYGCEILLTGDEEVELAQVMGAGDAAQSQLDELYHADRDQKN